MNHVSSDNIMKSFGDIDLGLGQLLNAKIIQSGSIEHANQQQSCID